MGGGGKEGNETKYNERERLTKEKKEEKISQ